MCNCQVGKIGKDIIVRNVKMIVGDKLLIAAIQSIRGQVATSLNSDVQDLNCLLASPAFATKIPCHTKYWNNVGLACLFFTSESQLGLHQLTRFI